VSAIADLIRITDEYYREFGPDHVPRGFNVLIDAIIKAILENSQGAPATNKFIIIAGSFAWEGDIFVDYTHDAQERLIQALYYSDLPRTQLVFTATYTYGTGERDVRTVVDHINGVTAVTDFTYSSGLLVKEELVRTP